MLKELRIQNLALVEELNIVFDSSLVVFSGETGAGKSIILQAIDLLSGKRTASSLIRNGCDHARVEALFDMQEGSELIDTIQDMGIETDGEVLISRVLSRKSKNRFYINGGLSTAKVAERISEYLVSVASQHDHQLLLLSRHHLDFLDLAGNLWQDRISFGKLYGEWCSVKVQYETLCDKEREKEQRRDFLKFQVQEIIEAQIQPSEDEILQRQKNRLKSADELRRRGSNCFKLLSVKAADSLALARKELDAMAGLDNSLDDLAAMVAEQSFVIEESVAGIRKYIDKIPYEMHSLEGVTERIDLLQKLKRKYGISLEAVLEYADDAQKELNDLDSMDILIQQVEKQYMEVEKRLQGKASELSQLRKQAGDHIVTAIEDELTSLSFDQARFSVLFNEPDRSDLTKITKKGWDKPEFLFSANPGEPLKPLAKVASGGELSRLTLAMKCILARKDMVETVIFDEIDAGIGGKAAESVAIKIKELSQHHQVMCITHLPQIAACAREHLLVEKMVDDNRTKTTIVQLSEKGRVNELARMLDGETVSPKSLAFAKELISRNK
jgi:DNA repair protein RecN (Recombination protein N)